MSFGCSISDFITILQLSNKIRERFVDAPEQFKAISDEVRSLSIIVDDVKVVLPQRDLTNKQRKELSNIFVGCYNVLDKLKETLDKYQELDSDSGCSDSKRIGYKFRRVWKRLRLEPEDIKELRSRITSNVTMLNTFNGQLTQQVSSEIRDGVDRLHERQDDREQHDEHRTILDWLTPIDYAPQHNDFIGRQKEGTGEWLLKSNEFQEWINQTRQTIFCPGIPGAGKTIITSIVVEHLWIKFQKDLSVGMAYLYCSFQRQHEQKQADLLMSLLKQLVQERNPMPETLRSLYNRHKDKRSRPSLDEILKELHSVVRLYSKVFIIVDALDECQASEDGRSQFLRNLFSLQSQAHVNTFATSRFIPEIESRFESCIRKEIRAQHDDILRYLDGRIPQLLRSQISKYSDLQDLIRSEVVNAVDGMFLLAQLHMDSLMSSSTRGDIKLALRNLPKGTKRLDATYEQAMKRIAGQDEGSRELAKQVLSWVICAKRPLTTTELQYALAVRVGMMELDEDFVPEVEVLLSVCAGLVTVDEKSNVIRLVHYTAQEYFERTHIDWFPTAQTDIAKTCVRYLLFDTFETSFCLTDTDFEEQLQLNPLYDYAARNWGHHARAASTELELEQLIMDLLESEAKISRSSQAMTISRSYLGYSQRIPKQMTGVHLAAYFGLREAMITLLKNEHSPNVKDSYGRTPLSWAAESGHDAVVKLLFEKGGVDLDSKDKHGQTPLLWAAGNGHNAVVKLLLEKGGVDLDSKNKYGQTPLSWAAGNGYDAVVKLLLEKGGVDLDSKDKHGRTPLSWAAVNGYDAVVKLLLGRGGVDLDSKDNEYGGTPLSWAAENGHDVVVKLLLEKGGVDLDSKDKYGQTPLSWAAENGYDAVVKLLLEKGGVDLDSKDIYGRTPLSRAAGNGHDTVVKLLLEKGGVDLDSKDDECGGTPLSWAAGNGHDAVVKLLLEKGGVDLDSKDKYGRTPLSRAAGYGHNTVVKLLFEKGGADLDSKDKYGRTPLSWAAGYGHDAMVKLLLEKGGVDLDSKDKYGRTPLSRAVGFRHNTVVKLLLEKGAVDLGSKDK